MWNVFLKIPCRPDELRIIRVFISRRQDADVTVRMPTLPCGCRRYFAKAILFLLKSEADPQGLRQVDF